MSPVRKVVFEELVVFSWPIHPGGKCAIHVMA